jgi:hypothetical protein
VRRLSLHGLLGLILATILAGLLSVIIWSLGRGFDITDESLALLSYLYPDEYPANFSMGYRIVSRVTGWMHPTVIGYRWLTLAIRLLTTIAFTCGFYQWLRRFCASEPSGSVRPAIVFPYLLIGSLSAYALGLSTLNYNTLNSAFLFSAAALLFYVLSRAPMPGARRRAVVIALFAVGFFSALDVFVKFSTAIIMFSGVLLLVLVQMRRLGARTIVLGVGILILGAVAGLAVYFADVQSMAAWFSNYRAELRVVAEVSHNPAALVRSYLRDGASLVQVLMRHFWLIFLVSFAIARCYARGWHRQAPRNQYVLLTLLGLILLYTGYKVYALDLLNSPYFNRSVTFYTYVLIICFQIIVLLATYRIAPPAPKPNQAEVRSGNTRLGLALLLFLPFVAAIGTTNWIFLNALYDIEAWFALILVLALLIEERTRSRLALPLCILLPTCFVASQLAYCRIWRPYLSARWLPEQTVALHEPVSVAGLKVDPATAAFISGLRSTLRRGSFQEGDYLLAFYNAPGLVLLMKGISLGTPQYMQGEDPINCHALTSAKRTNRPVFILATRKVDPPTVACLQKAGVRFPDEFVELGRIYNPYSASPYGWRAGERWVTVYRQNEQR